MKRKSTIIFCILLSICFFLVSCSFEKESNQKIIPDTSGISESITENTTKIKTTLPEENDPDIVVLSGKNIYKEYSDGYKYFSFVAKNCTDDVINTLTLHINILDKSGNIVNSTGAQESTRVKPDQTINMESMCEITDDAYSAVVDGYYYLIGDEVYEGYIDNSPEINLK